MKYFYNFHLDLNERMYLIFIINSIWKGTIMNNLKNIEKLLISFNKTFINISKNLFEEDIDTDIFIDIFEKILEVSDYLCDNEISQIYPIKLEEAISLAINFYENFDHEIFKKIKNILLQVENGYVLNIYNIHSLTKNDFFKKNSFGLPKYTTHGRNYSSAGNCYIYVPTRLELHGKKQDSIIREGYCTIYDAYTLVHELGHILDTDLTLPRLQIETFTKIEAEFVFNYTRGVFCEVTTSFLESIFTQYLLKNSSIPKSYIFYNVISKYNDRVYRANLFFFILIMDELFKENDKIYIDDIIWFMDKYNYNEKQIEDFLITLIDNQNIFSSIMPYAIDHVFSPILTREILENKKSGIIKFKKYTKAVIDDKLYDIFKVYSINFKRKNYIDLIVNNYKWFYEYEKKLINGNLKIEED